MEIKLKGRAIPRTPGGDANFTKLGTNFGGPLLSYESEYILDIFTPEEVVELVNRALYQLEYQREAHKKRGAEQRAKEKALREALKKQGVDLKKTKIDNELKGE